jgi:hypothetical protein
VRRSSIRRFQRTQLPRFCYRVLGVALHHAGCVNQPFPEAVGATNDGCKLGEVVLAVGEHSIADCRFRSCHSSLVRQQGVTRDQVPVDRSTCRQAGPCKRRQSQIRDIDRVCISSAAKASFLPSSAIARMPACEPSAFASNRASPVSSAALS